MLYQKCCSHSQSSPFQSFSNIYWKSPRPLCQCFARHWTPKNKQNQTPCSYGPCSLAGETDFNQIIAQINAKLQWGWVATKEKYMVPGEDVIVAFNIARMVWAASLLSWAERQRRGVASGKGARRLCGNGPSCFKVPIQYMFLLTVNRQYRV